ncbi:hypothetical protein OROGR_024021 [Orobanche gracilis]
MNGPSFAQKVASDMIRPPLDKVEWKDLLNNKATPRAKFSLWMALGGRLVTKDRMMCFDNTIDPLCRYCTQEHNNIKASVQK